MAVGRHGCRDHVPPVRRFLAGRGLRRGRDTGVADAGDRSARHRVRGGVHGIDRAACRPRTARGERRDGRARDGHAEGLPEHGVLEGDGLEPQHRHGHRHGHAHRGSRVDHYDADQVDPSVVGSAAGRPGGGRAHHRARGLVVVRHGEEPHDHRLVGQLHRRVLERFRPGGDRDHPDPIGCRGPHRRAERARHLAHRADRGRSTGRLAAGHGRDRTRQCPPRRCHPAGRHRRAVRPLRHRRLPGERHRGAVPRGHCAGNPAHGRRAARGSDQPEQLCPRDRLGNDRWRRGPDGQPRRHGPGGRRAGPGRCRRRLGGQDLVRGERRGAVRSAAVHHARVAVPGRLRHRRDLRPGGPHGRRDLGLRRLRPSRHQSGGLLVDPLHQRLVPALRPRDRRAALPSRRSGRVRVADRGRTEHRLDVEHRVRRPHADHRAA